MADVIITLTIPDAYVSRLSDAIDSIWSGREQQVPIPSKAAWLKYNIGKIIKQQVNIVERNNATVPEIEVL